MKLHIDFSGVEASPAELLMTSAVGVGGSGAGVEDQIEVSSHESFSVLC